MRWCQRGTNWSLWGCLLLSLHEPKGPLVQRGLRAAVGDCPCRFATVKHNLIATVCRSPTAYFLLVEKVGKAPPRGKPLGYPQFITRRSPFYFRHEGVEWANHLPRSPAPAAVRMSICLFFGVPCFGCVIHHCTILPIYESGSGKLILQCMAARADRRSRKSRIMVGETTDGTSLLLILCMSQRQKREVRNRRGFGGVLGTFSPRKKYPVGDRHQLPLGWC